MMDTRYLCHYVICLSFSIFEGCYKCPIQELTETDVNDMFDQFGTLVTHTCLVFSHAVQSPKHFMREKHACFNKPRIFVLLYLGGTNSCWESRWLNGAWEKVNLFQKNDFQKNDLFIWDTCNLNLMLYGCSCNPFAPRSMRWKSLSVFWLCFPWEPQAASCRTPWWIWWIVLEDESASTALAISAAVSIWAPPRPTRSSRVSNNELFPDAMGSRLHLLAFSPFPGKTIWHMNHHMCVGGEHDTVLCQLAACGST